MFRFSFKNIQKQFKNSMLYIIIFSQIIAVMMLYFVYGLFSSYRAAKQELTIDSYTIEASFKEETGTEFSELEKCFGEILDTVQKRLDYFYIMGRCDGIMINIHNEYHKGTFGLAGTISKNMEIKDGRFFDEEEITNAQKVVIGNRIGEVGEKVRLGEENYQIIGTQKYSVENETPIAEVSYTVCPAQTELVTVILNFRDLPRQSDYLAFREGLIGVFGDRVIVDEFAVMDEEQLVSFNSIMIFSVAIGIAIALDTSLLYAYIIHKRKKQMAVFALNGATRRQLFLINEMEISLISVLTMAAGFCIFKWLAEKRVKLIFDNVTEVFTGSVYAKLSGIYFGCMLAVTSVAVFWYSDPNIMKMIRKSR